MNQNYQIHNLEYSEYVIQVSRIPVGSAGAERIARRECPCKTRQIKNAQPQAQKGGEFHHSSFWIPARRGCFCFRKKKKISPMAPTWPRTRSLNAAKKNIGQHLIITPSVPRPCGVYYLIDGDLDIHSHPAGAYFCMSSLFGKQLR